MGCLNIKVERIGEGVGVQTRRIGEGVGVQPRRIGGMSVTCRLVCPVSKTRVLKVEPKAVFLMPGNSFTDNVLVISNVNWQVK